MIDARVLLAGAACALALQACSGQGKYTAEGVSLAEKKMAALKAATEHEMAEQAFLAGELEKAERKLQRAIALAPDAAVNYVLLGRVSLEQGRIGAALASLERAIDIDDEHAEGHYFLGVVHERLRRPDEALVHFQAAAEAEPLDPQYTVAAAEMLVDLDRLDDAETYLMESDVYDHAPAVKQLLGHIAMIRGLHDEAADRFSEATLLAPQDDTIREDFATALVSAGRFGAAEQELSRLMAAEVDADGRAVEPAVVRRDLMHLRAMCLVALARPLEARGLYRELTEGPEGASDVDAWVGLGRSAFLIGDHRSLRRAGERASAIDPSRPDGFILLALSARTEGDGEAALAALNAFDGRPTVDLRTLKALVLADLERYDDARQQLLAALDEAPGDASAMRLLDQLPERRLDTFATAPTE